jgi:hypothetical protein
MESQDATTDFLFEWFGKYAQLERILSDKGPLFFAELVKAFLKRFGLKITIGSPYHPYRTRKVERTVQFVITIISKLSYSLISEWDL